MTIENNSLESWKGTNVVLGVSFGDEGKGKVVDKLAQNAKIIARYNGGPNAGHTVINNYGEFKLHQIPSGIFNPDAISIIGPTVIIDPFILIQELKDLREHEIDVSASNLLISEDSHLIMPWHRKRDGLKEEAREGGKVGTTGRGIGPTYADRTERDGLKVRDLKDPNLEAKFDKEFKYQEKVVGEMDRDKIFKEFIEAKEVIEPFIKNVFRVMSGAYYSGVNILGEGAQGALLDLDLGNYPFVTSSSPGVSGFYRAFGGYIGVKRILGVTKAYQTRVGEGPMPTEIHGPIEEKIREIGKEYGTSTGRPRRIGWFDVPATIYGSEISGAKTLAITKLDVLDHLDRIRVCVAYATPQGVNKYLPSYSPEFLSQAEPVYEDFKGWRSDTSQIKCFNDLPTSAQFYIRTLEELIEKKIEFISNGPHREQYIYR